MRSHWCLVTKCKGDFLLWDSVLRYFYNSSELYSQTPSFISPVCTYAASLGLSCFQQHTIPRNNISSWLAKSLGSSPLLGDHMPFSLPWLFLLSGLGQDSPSPPNVFGLIPKFNHEIGHGQILSPSRSLLQAYCNWKSLPWPNEHKIEQIDEGRVISLWHPSRSNSECPATCTYLSLLLGYTQCVEEIGCFLFMVKINIYQISELIMNISTK